MHAQYNNNNNNNNNILLLLLLLLMLLLVKVLAVAVYTLKGNRRRSVERSQNVSNAVRA